MKKIGFIGSGSIGAPMARCIIRAGFEVAVCDANVQALKEMVWQTLAPYLAIPLTGKAISSTLIHNSAIHQPKRKEIPSWVLHRQKCS